MSSTLFSDDHWNGKLFTGIWTTGSSNSPVIEPATGAVLGQVAMADAQIIRKSAATARECQKAWAGKSYDQRAAILRRTAVAAEQHFEEIVNLLVKESGSVRAKAQFEVSLSIKCLQESSALPASSCGEVLPSAPGQLSLARRRPLGVVGVISPFNFPMYLAMRAVAPALALGNGVVLKPDPRTAVCGGYTIARLFELADLPSGLLHVLPGDGMVGAALIADPDIAMIQFTGSTQAGRKVAESAGRHLKKVSLELGGKNSLIVLDDADIETAVANAAWGSFLHQGQICMASGRILVQRNIYDRFVIELATLASSLKVGNPADSDVALGPLINEAQLNHVAHVVRTARETGAKVMAGGNADGLFYPATVLADVSPANDAFRSEIFGPVAVLTPFDTDDEAIALANDTEYGLSAGVITRDVGRALRIGDQLRTGLLHINDQTVNDDVINPFGGIGASGNGTSIGGPANWEEFTQWQWVTVKGEAPKYIL